jgi:hypothetical protein
VIAEIADAIINSKEEWWLNEHWIQKRRQISIPNT